MQQLSAPLRGLQCIASSHGSTNRHLRRTTRQQHGMTRHSSRRLQAPSKRATLIKRKALQKGGASSSNTSSKTVPQKRIQQLQGSSGSSQPVDSTSSPYWWLQRLPGDSGWDVFRMRDRDAKTFNRIREAEVVHARWAMLGVISLLLSDVSGSPFPPKEASFAALAPWGVVALLCLGLIETYRLAALWDEDDFEKRAYPGKKFDVLGFTRPKTTSSKPDEPEQLPGFGVFAPWLGGLAGWLAGGWWFEQREMTQVELMDMKSRELRNGRLAMVSFVGCCMASALTGKGPITLLMQHLADPVHTTIVQALQ